MIDDNPTMRSAPSEPPHSCGPATLRTTNHPKNEKPGGVNAAARNDHADPRASNLCVSEPRDSSRPAAPRDMNAAAQTPRDMNVATQTPRDINAAARSGRGGTYLLTWTTHGSWLPGDERGFVGRVPDGRGGQTVHNQPGSPYDADMPALRAAALARRKTEAVRLGSAEAQACLAALAETAERHGLTLWAAAVMATHVHAVVASPVDEGPRLLNLFKGVSSRRLGQRFGPRTGGAWWTRHGSRRLLPDARAAEAAIRYVKEQAGVLAICVR